jgi:hypothetical protein
MTFTRRAWLTVLLVFTMAAGGKRPRRTPLDPSELAALTAALDAAKFSEEKLAVLQQATRASAFTCAQVVALLDHVDFVDTKVRAVVVVAPWLSDPGNARLIIDSFSGIEREHVAAILSR